MALRDLNKADLWFTADGDFLIDGSGDLRDTLDSGSRYESVIQAILHRILGERGAFRQHPNITAGLGDFIGQTLDQKLMENIQYVIHQALVSDGSLSRSDYEIRVMELNAGALAIFIYVNLPGQEHPLISMAWNIKSGEVTQVL